MGLSWKIPKIPDVVKPFSDLLKNTFLGGKKDQPEDGASSGTHSEGEISDVEPTPISVEGTNDPDKYISDESIHSPCAGPHVAIGIDLGTCNASAGAFKGNHVAVIETSDGKRKIPCCVSFTKIGRLIGVAAEDQAENYMNNTIFNVKGLIGSTCNTYNIQDYKKGLAPLNIKETNNRPTVQVEYQGGHKEFLPEEIASMILVEMKECAKAYLKSNVKDAVITVPANFTDSQRIATRDAGRIAGLNVLEIINDTTAVAITYHSLQIWNEQSKEKNVLIMDLGGGTFNMAVIKVTTDNIEVKSAAGSTFGGGDFDANLVGNFVEINKNKYQEGILNDLKTLAKLRKAFEKAKSMLFNLKEAQVNVPNFNDGNDLPLTVTRAMFEEVNWRQLKWCTEAVKACVLDAKMEPCDIDDIVLVGGSSRIPHVQQFLQTYFKKEHFQKIHPDEAVVEGAAIRAAFLTNNKEQLQGFPSISPNPPAIQNIRPYFSIWSYDFHYKVHMPISEIKLTTNKPHEMSISTTTDNQVSIPIFVYGGEGPSVHAQFSISGIPPRSAAFVHAGEGPNLYTQFTISNIPPQEAPTEISISFTINNDGILSLKAHAKVGEKTDFLVKKEYFEGLKGSKIKEIKEKEADMSKIEEQDKLRREKRLAAIVSFKSFISKKKSEFKDKPHYSAIEDQAKSAYMWMRSNPDATEDEIMNQMKEFEVNSNNLLIER